MAAGAAEAMLRCVFDGSISMSDMEIERRPYHRNCSCAMHKLKGVCSNACSQQKNISYSKKQSWDDCSLSIKASKFSSQSCFLVQSRGCANEVLSQNFIRELLLWAKLEGKRLGIEKPFYFICFSISTHSMLL